MCLISYLSSVIYLFVMSFGGALSDLCFTIKALHLLMIKLCCSDSNLMKKVGSWADKCVYSKYCCSTELEVVTVGTDVSWLIVSLGRCNSENWYDLVLYLSILVTCYFVKFVRKELLV